MARRRESFHEWYVASMDEMKAGEMTLEHAILECMNITDDGRKYVSGTFPWFVKKVFPGFYTYSAPPNRCNSTLFIGTKENMIKQGFEEHLTLWEEERGAYEVWKKQ